MDRDRIERRDFPTGRRGYDPAAVDEHLRRVADEFEARAHAPAPSFAASTSDQVRHILEAAERGATELRTAAGTEASEHVSRVQEAADGMLAKLDALESELTRLMTALRTSGERLAEGLADLQSQATAGLAASESGVDRTEHAELRTREPADAGDAQPGAAATPPAAVTPPATADDAPTAAPPAPADDAPAAATTPADDLPAAAATPPATADDSPAADDAPAATTSAADDAPAAATPDEPPPVTADSPHAATSPGAVHDSPPLSAPGAPDWPAPSDALFESADDTLFAPAEEPDDAGARLIALNMALNGSPRDDTRVFLEEHFSLPDVEALLDDVYARAGR